MNRLARLSVGLLLVLASNVSAATIVPGFHITGKVALNEPHSCDGGGSSGDLTQTQLLTWTECHAFKEHMDAAGIPITANAFDAAALRPLSVTVDIEVLCTYQRGAYGDAAPTTTVSVQTDTKGMFGADVPASKCGQTASADGVMVRTSARLKFDMIDARGVAGTVRALWDKSQGMTVYNSVVSAAEPVLYSEWGMDFVIPRFILGISSFPLPMPASVALGNQTFYDGASATSYDYLRGAMGAWQTLVRLHSKLRDILAAEGSGPLYRKMFVDDPARACAQCWSLNFIYPGAGASGSRGSFALAKPSSSPGPMVYRGLVAVGLPAHEFGHSIHAGIASGSWGLLDGAMHATMDPAGAAGGYHAIYVAAPSILQQQELGVAFHEGFANAIGTYFVSGCKVPQRSWGNVDPKLNMWNPAQYRSCDGINPTCPYSAFRYQMVQRGIREDSREWNARLEALAILATQASAPNAIVVTSNSEGKLMNFFCDLLDSDSDVSYAAGQIADKSFVADLMWHAAERLDGRTPAVTMSWYGSDPVAETETVGLGKLLSAMDAFAPAANASPAVVPAALWPTITDGANGPYNDMRISVNGVLSAQSLGLYMVNSGYLRRASLNSILRANRMEEVP